MNKQLYRSRDNKRIAGVCGGVAEYFNIDPTIVRLVWVLFTITYGIGFVAYIVAVIIIPERKTDNFGYNQGQNQNESHQGQNQNENHHGWNENEHRDKAGFDNTKGRVILGAALVLVGMILLSSYYIPWISLRQLWPLILVAFGVLMLFSGGRNRK